MQDRANVSNTASELRRLELHLLGGFRLSSESGEVPLSQVGQHLIAYLALRGGRASRLLVSGVLWPEKAEARAAANLRSTLWRMPNVDGRSLVQSLDAGEIQLHDSIDTDLRQLDTATAAFESSHPVAVDCHLFQHSLLPGWYEDWVVSERRRIEQQQLHAMTCLVASHVAAGNMAMAIDVGFHLVNLDPLREASQRALVSALLADGSFGAVQQQIHLFTESLIDAFGTGVACPFRIDVQNGHAVIVNSSAFVAERVAASR